VWSSKDLGFAFFFRRELVPLRVRFPKLAAHGGGAVPILLELHRPEQGVELKKESLVLVDVRQRHDAVDPVVFVGCVVGAHGYGFGVKQGQF